MLEGFDNSYLVGTAVVWTGLLGAVIVFVRFRPWRSPRPAVRVVARVFLTTWSLAILVAALETGFALLYDTTDSFALLKTSQRWRQRHIRTNNMGTRDEQDFSAKRPPGKRRIVILGDSFAFGHGIARTQDRFGDRLAARLEANYPGEFQLYNFATPAEGTKHHLDRLEKWRRDGFELDAILLVYVLNDLEDLVPANADIMGTILLDRPSFWLWRETYLFNFLYYRYRQFSRPELQSYFVWLKDSYAGEPWRAQRDRLDKLRRDAADRGVALGVAVFPFLQNLGPDYPFRSAHEVVDAYWREHNVPQVDLLSTMEAHRAERLTVNRFDAHPSERAHALAADAIWDGVLEELAQQLRSESRESR